MTPEETTDQYRNRAYQWLSENLTLLEEELNDDDGGVAAFLNVDLETERKLLNETVVWHQQKLAAGFAAIDWPLEYGGQGLPSSYTQIFQEEEAKFVTPDVHEAFIVTTGMVAPTIRDFGSELLRRKVLKGILDGSDTCVQLLSEPDAGSDLASVATRAVRDGKEWIVNGQKVWSSAAHFSKWGFLLARSNPEVSKHKGLTIFLVPLDAEGIEIRPLKQMTGGSVFNEVFLTDAVIPDYFRIGEEGQGWNIVMATLSHERSGTENWTAGGSYAQVCDLAFKTSCNNSALVRQKLAQLYIGDRLIQWNAQRAAALHKGGPPGADANIGKLLYGMQMDRVTDSVSHILGLGLVAEANEDFRWGEHVTGTPAYHIAGGTDEIQRNILGSRYLGLPNEPHP